PVELRAARGRAVHVQRRAGARVLERGPPLRAVLGDRAEKERARRLDLDLEPRDQRACELGAVALARDPLELRARGDARPRRGPQRERAAHAELGPLRALGEDRGAAAL